MQEQFQQQAQKDPAGFRLALREAFGDKADLSQLDLLLDLALAGKLPMPANIQFVEAGSLGSNAFGAYDSSYGGSLYLDISLLSDPAKRQSVFNEEMGHHLDALLGGVDAAGDEGAVFSRTLEQGQLSQTELTSLKNENDHGVIQLEGRWVQVEFNEEGSDDGGDGGDGSEGGGGECSVGGGGNAGAGGSQTSDNEDGGTGGTGGECNVDGPPCSGDGPPGGDNRDDEKDDKPSSGNGSQEGDDEVWESRSLVDAESKPEEKGFWSRALDTVQTGLDLAGFVPGLERYRICLMREYTWLAVTEARRLSLRQRRYLLVGMRSKPGPSGSRPQIVSMMVVVRSTTQANCQKQVNNLTRMVLPKLGEHCKSMGIEKAAHFRNQRVAHLKEINKDKIYSKVHNPAINNTQGLIDLEAKIFMIATQAEELGSMVMET